MISWFRSWFYHKLSLHLICSTTIGNKITIGIMTNIIQILITLIFVNFRFSKPTKQANTTSYSSRGCWFFNIWFLIAVAIAAVIIIISPAFARIHIHININIHIICSSSSCNNLPSLYFQHNFLTIPCIHYHTQWWLSTNIIVNVNVVNVTTIIVTVMVVIMHIYLFVFLFICVMLTMEIVVSCY